MVDMRVGEQRSIRSRKEQCTVPLLLERILRDEARLALRLFRELSQDGLTLVSANSIACDRHELWDFFRRHSFSV